MRLVRSCTTVTSGSSRMPLNASGLPRVAATGAVVLTGRYDTEHDTGCCVVAWRLGEIRYKVKEEVQMRKAEDEMKAFF
jgi:hypothetical protein